MARARITQKDLEEQVQYINELAGTPQEPHTPTSGGCYHLDYAYGGVKLVQICKDGSSAIRTISRDGFDTKRKLYDFMVSFAYGLEVSNG
jgi:hypothetical protein